MRLIFDAESAAKEIWEAKLTAAAGICLANEGMTDHCEISVSFVDAAEIRRLNAEYRSTDQVTDVLSFPMFEADEVAAMSEKTERERTAHRADDFYLPLGDVVICEEQARRQAEEYGHSYEREVVYLFVHSVLHLLGYDHIEEEDRSLMRVQEEIVMRELGLPRETEAAEGGGKEEYRVFSRFASAHGSQEEQRTALLEIAKGALIHSYAPFSKFRVGAALLTKDDYVCTGVNVENSSFGATICAERTAFVKALSCGVHDFKAIAVVSSAGSAWPCGICRQFMKEFCDDDFEIISLDQEGNIRSYTLPELLPEGFRL